jgi:hypothetical protein
MKWGLSTRLKVKVAKFTSTCNSKKRVEVDDFKELILGVE